MNAARPFETSGVSYPDDLSSERQRCGNLESRISCFISSSIPGQRECFKGKFLVVGPLYKIAGLI
jgi:hypothetical protein